uniref:hypothetical protein n=1 Tax=Natrarchaeobius halalkaliphilus TaxID=1679091 RepID=UPI001A9E382C|nr:hypothetical protein [Natrarchaeobius halalkaliphilus]
MFDLEIVSGGFFGSGSADERDRKAYDRKREDDQAEQCEIVVFDHRRQVRQVFVPEYENRSGCNRDLFPVLVVLEALGLARHERDYVHAERATDSVRVRQRVVEPLDVNFVDSAELV